ncbi:hypothetical protein HN018_21580 [Lichenicola cladoniae]|uniref:Uncharacterized protein n=1 Tax=Lichenicola cladoniae TaxID=1484109 RepID=A0A6M8HVY2_9PROT|nr:STY0301 family protein [Lichenicola cladoniae]NPD66652.1 hypothetical protein [Acetobacteraceae bacterium]QKE92281.1 hypothetical protein HN018_21580 [Lichenicola cladoniae]
MRNSARWPLLFLAIVACTGAAPANCPSSLIEAGSDHTLVNASLYDGPPDQMADLIPVPAGSVDRWSLDGVDPFLVCKFQGIMKVVTLHVVGAKVCEAGQKPFQAYCKR